MKAPVYQTGQIEEFALVEGRLNSCFSPSGYGLLFGAVDKIVVLTISVACAAAPALQAGFYVCNGTNV